MPRLVPSLLLWARLDSPFLPALLRECRDLGSSRNELRWLTEHAIEQATRKRRHDGIQYAREHLSVSIGTPRARRRRLTTRSGAVLIRPGWRQLLWGYVKRRERGEPLQYIIGTQPFGEVEILCRPGVLIPRSETELYTSKLGSVVKEFLKWSKDKRLQEYGKDGDANKLGPTHTLRLLDLCTGTGCIPLHLYEMLSRSTVGQERMQKKESKQRLEVLGVDISPIALRLANKNLNHNIALRRLDPRAAKDISFLRANVLATATTSDPHQHGDIVPSSLQVLRSTIPSQTVDILTVNPPYISRATYRSPTMARSVRNHEPRLALVPDTSNHQIVAPASSARRASATAPAPAPVDGDEFYHHLLPLSAKLEAGITVLEVGDTEQARRVIEIVRQVVKREMEEKGKEDKRRRRKNVGAHDDSNSRDQSRHSHNHDFHLVETWFDDGSIRMEEEEGEDRTGDPHREPKPLDTNHPHPRTAGPEISARAIVLWRREWAEWRRQTTSRRD